MIKMQVKYLQGMPNKLKKHELQAKGNIAATKRRLVKDVFTDLVKGSPQWSGNLAQNWYIEFHGFTGTYEPIPGYDEKNWNEGEHYQVGANPAVARTLGREVPRIAQIRWNSKVQIANYTPYAEEVEAGQGPDGKPIREENYKYGQIAMVGYVNVKYNALRTLKRRI